MKKVLFLLASLIFMPVAHAYDYNAANIKINISGAIHNNSYFLCIPNIGCLSIMAAKKGKVFPILHPIEMDNIYVLDRGNNYRIQSQGLPKSCNVTVATNHTITISGNLSVGANNQVRLSGLHCSVSGA